MFNNPLRRFQDGGAAPSDDQQKFMLAFIQWLPTKIPEFKDAQPEEIVATINQAMQSEEGQSYVADLMAQFQQEMQGQSFRNGGKIHDFICKHAKGGKVNCGCGGLKFNEGGKTKDKKMKKSIDYKQSGGQVTSVPDGYRGLNRRQSIARLQQEGFDRSAARDLYNRRAEQIGETASGAPVTGFDYGHQGTSRADISYDLFGDNGQFTSRDTMMNAASPYYSNAKSMRQAYRDEKQNLRNSGMRGLAMREQARNNIIGNATMPEIQFDNSFDWGSGSPIQDDILLINDYAPELSVPEKINVPITTLPVSTPTTSTTSSDWRTRPVPPSVGGGLQQTIDWDNLDKSKWANKSPWDPEAVARRQARRQARRDALANHHVWTEADEAAANAEANRRRTANGGAVPFSGR